MEYGHVAERFVMLVMSVVVVDNDIAHNHGLLHIPGCTRRWFIAIPIYCNIKLLHKIHRHLDHVSVLSLSP